ncbi:HlyD family efflux transporter periplasmic adaptor subunit [uncultured Flavonifractor sp.]|uniref:HlyD family efflux transporter periplasmic adaptor subunit n=1 Tax=uncultured Flavonifractor sp. TaxID=1193534 RepID=UPI00263986FA|nr:HlyD family efflux transporter periplasmic adaptor subunit [uncultured Flavonifractor sp.]
MKQGTLNSKIVMLLLLAAAVVYLAVSAWQSFRDPFTTAATYSYTVDDSMEATGFLVREEQVLTQTGGTVELLPQEGEKVAKGGTVALLYQDASGLERRQQLQQLELEKEQLEYALERSDLGGGDSAQLSQQVLDAIISLRASAASGDLTGLESQAMNLKSLVYKREYAYTGTGDTAQDSAAGIQAALDEVNNQISALSAQASQSTSRLTASQSGIFSGYVDGYESLLTPEMLESVTPAQLEQLAQNRPAENPDAVGKLITNSTWYFACSLPAESAERLVEGRTVTVRFSRDWSGEITMTVYRVGEAENGQTAVVLSTDKYLSDTTLLRRQTVELVFGSVTGVRIPKEALRVEEQTVTDEETGEQSQVNVPGVYALVGEQAEFKPVTILLQGDGYALAEAAATGRKALRSGDLVIVAAEDLYDGKVIS